MSVVSGCVPWALLVFSLAVGEPAPAPTPAPPAPESVETSSCAATSMWEVLLAQVPQTDETRRLRARILHGRGLASQSEAAADPLKAARLCLESVVDYGEVMTEHYAGTEQETIEGRRVEQVAQALRHEIEAMEAALPPPPPPSPHEVWTRRNRRLIAETSVSAFFTTAGFLMATIPWIYLRICPDPDPAFGCGEGLGAVVLTGVGLPNSVAGGIWFAVSATRLIKHRHARPPRLVLGRGRWQMRWGPPTAAVPQSPWARGVQERFRSPNRR